MFFRLLTLGSTMLLSVACIEGMDRPGDAKVISFPDLTVDGGGRHDGEDADMRVDRLSPDARDDVLSPDSRVDGLSPDSRVDTLSPDATLDTLSPDATVDTLSPDTSVDSVSSDGTVDGPWSDSASAAGCASSADPSTVMLLTFEGTGTTVTDVTGDHDGTLVNDSRASRIAGIVGCGRALALNPGNGFAYIEVPDSPDWVIDNGSVDLWLNAHARPTSRAGIMSRNDSGTGDGEFALTQLCNGSIMARFQVGGMGRSVCSDPIANDAWHHVGVNFGTGGLALFVDGQRATRSLGVYCAGMLFDCGEATTQGLTARSNPWVIGARSGDSDPGSATPADHPFEGAIDSVRISTIRRIF